MKKLKTKYKWRNRKSHFSFLKLQDSFAETVKLGINMLIKENLKTDVFSFLGKEKRSSEEVPSRSSGNLQHRKMSSAVEGKLGTTIPGKWVDNGI